MTARLARLHYRAAAPATVVRVMTATDETTGELAGVLLTSRPTTARGGNTARTVRRG